MLCEILRSRIGETLRCVTSLDGFRFEPNRSRFRFQHRSRLRFRFQKPASVSVPETGFGFGSRSRLRFRFQKPASVSVPEVGFDFGSRSRFRFRFQKPALVSVPEAGFGFGSSAEPKSSSDSNSCALSEIRIWWFALLGAPSLMAQTRARCYRNESGGSRCWGSRV